MEIIYNWLLHNTGNEGNYLTILNVQRHKENGEAAALEVMARTKEFAVINLLIKPGSSTNQSADLQGRTLQETHFFADEDQTIAYLSEGKKTNDEPSPQGMSLYILLPTSDTGDISFPTQ